ncbi:MAG: alpha-amylase family glycosyl hydrolase [Flavobacterium sp.]
MKNFLLFALFLTFASQAQVQTITPTVAPNPFERNQSITITVQGSQINEATWGVTGNALYLWAWMQDANGNALGDCPTNGTWAASSEANKLTYNSGNDTYTMTFVPETFFNNSVFGKMGFLVKAKDGSGDKKTNDNIFNVGAFQVTLSSPAENSTTIISTNTNASVVANNTGGAATYTLKANGVTVSGPTTTTFFTAGPLVTQNTIFTLEITQGATTITKKFSYLFNPGTISQAIPSGKEDGINYDSSDTTKATLVLNAPYKDFVYVAGNFNNWQPTAAYAMKKDATTGKFWLELTGLTPGQVYAYQYWVGDVTNRPANSPAVVKTADPFSTLVLSPFDDPEIISLGVYPGLPVYNTIAPGQEREVTVLQTGPSAWWNYNWSSATTNFVKPKKKDLVIYEVLVRDFDADRSYQNLIDRMDYFKNLKINAIQLMPVMEFEGNESWGYNTVFHMAPDKRYGSPAKLKEFIDLCHQNGIAVILDVALNHVFGRSPLERMWMLDTDNDGWANGTGYRVSAENPYCNQDAMHSYSVGTDLNHFREPDNLTNTYVVKTIKTWIQDYKIDGFRWDLTKGFTNQCPPSVAGGQETCTNGYRSDRVAKMKWYADKQWEQDPNFLVIFEHLGTSGGSYDEEVEWSNYLRSGDSKGIMQWRKVTDGYANVVKGNFGDISGVTDASNRFVGYAESHDEERVVYKALTEGNSGTNQTFGNLTKVLQRLPAMGAIHILVPGPKMIWHFGELGWDKSLWTCNAGNVSYSNPDCKLDTKPQPQWIQNWLADTNRGTVYNTWAKLIDIKKTEDVFENGSYAWNLGTIGSPRLDVYTSTSQTASLSYVFVRTNFSDATLNTPGGFPFTGTWYNLMDNSSINVTSTSQTVSIEAGGFRVYGNQPAALGTDDLNAINTVKLYPNPTSGVFSISGQISKVQVYSITGQIVKSFDNIASEDYQFDVNDLTTGIYLVKAFDNNNSSKTMKLIKQ